MNLTSKLKTTVFLGAINFATTQASAFLYDNLNSENLDLNKWEEVSGSNLTSLLTDEHFIKNTSCSCKNFPYICDNLFYNQRKKNLA